jgi:hypothetical protein
VRRRLDRGHRRSRLLGWVRRQPVALVVLVCVVAGTTWTTSATDAAFTASSATGANSFTAGSVTITDNDAGSALLSLTGLVPGESHSSCITVNYGGTLPAWVKVYRTTGGTGLASYLDVTLTRGTVTSGAFGDCTHFTPDTVDYTGRGAGVLYDGTLAAFPTAVGTALDDPRGIGAPAVWTATDTHAYKITVTVQDNSAAQGLTATGSLVWQAVNVTGYPATVLADGPVAYWRLDETAGTTAVDATGHGHDGTYTGAPALHQPTGVTGGGTAVTFDGTTDQWVSVPWSSALNTAQFTVEAWVKATGGSGWRTVAASYSYASKTEGFGVWEAPGGDWEFFTNGAVPGSELSIGGPLAAAQWTHVVSTYDGAVMRLYVDGQLVSSQPQTHFTPATTAVLGIGAASYDDGGSWGDYFTGSIDEVAVYDKELRPEQIAAHYAAGKP